MNPKFPGVNPKKLSWDDNGIKAVKKIKRQVVKPSERLLKYLCITMIYYRQPAGDAAWAEIQNDIGHDESGVLAFWTGLMRAKASTEQLMEFVPELK